MGRPLSAQEDTNRRMLRARDEMDRRYAEPLDVPTLAAIAHLSVSQFGRVFKESTARRRTATSSGVGSSGR